ncbi:MAG: putative sulfate exporter family transporter [Lentisphaeria bacterium]|nr:putative sulfate exporter family transporter [Lentisphaeria bacterium]
MIKKICFIILTAAFFAVPFFWEPSRNWAPGIAVLSGIIFAVVWGNPFAGYTSKITSPLLGATIVGMGCGMDIVKVLYAGAGGFIYTMIGIAAGIGLGAFIGKKLGLPKNATYLVSVGTSICGGSAIAAAAPALNAKAHEVAMASATVFALNAVALFLFPFIGHQLGFSETQFGCWAALGIHDTSSVVGACLQYGNTALDVGTVMKLARALWIVPVTLFISWFVAGENGETEKRKLKLKVPWFIPGFLIAAAAVTFLPEYLPFITDAGKFIKDISKYLMVVTLFMIGANLSREKLKELGLKPVLLGIILWLILASSWCVVIYFNLVKCNI